MLCRPMLYFREVFEASANTFLYALPENQMIDFFVDIPIDNILYKVGILLS